MIPTVLLVGLLAGFAFGVTERRSVAVAGAIIAIPGWLALLSVGGDVDVTFALLVASALLAAVNFLVGGFVGWGIVKVFRALTTP